MAVLQVPLGDGFLALYVIICASRGDSQRLPQPFLMARAGFLAGGLLELPINMVTFALTFNRIV